MTASERAERTRAADERCAAAWEACAGPDSGAALVAVGGYGRGELAPYSDLDLVLVHAAGTDPGSVAERVWYPLWDAHLDVDHAVRSLPEMVAAVDADARVASGLLDVRHVAGDVHLTLRVRTTTLAQWRRRAREHLPGIRAAATTRHELMGELAHRAVPDLKEAEGGLRDATLLRSLVATWLVDVPHPELEACRQALLDVRDHVHRAAGRASDRITPETWSDLAAALDLPDEAAAQVHVRRLGRRVGHLLRLSWRRVEAVLTRPASRGAVRRPQLTPLAEGVALSGGQGREVVLHPRARPAQDPALLLRAATVAAERGAVLAPTTMARLVREAAPLPDPWPAEARRLLVRLLASGRGLLDVWETLDEAGALALVLPEWERVRLLPHASVIHRFTVDRHVVETCIEASSLIRSVARPDVLLVAALLHDIGKGGTTDHSIAGEPVARAVAVRMGFDPPAVDLVALLVRWHLLLARTATTRDPDDPATVELLTSRTGSPGALALLVALTEADARATAPQAWTAWRARLVRRLAQRAHGALVSGVAPAAPAGPTIEEMPVPAELARGSVSVTVERLADGSRVTFVALDRVGLLADLAGVLALQRLPVRAARVWAQEGYGVSVWDLGDDVVDPAVLRTGYEAVVAGRVDPRRRLARPSDGRDAGALAPSVEVRAEASEQATVLEVRAADRPGVVHLVCAALAELGVAVRSAHLDTLGPQAVDVFYLQEAHGGVLGDRRAAEAAYAVRAALTAAAAPKAGQSAGP